MANYKFSHYEDGRVAIQFEKCDSPLSEKTFIITDINFKDTPDDGGGFVEFQYDCMGVDGTLCPTPTDEATQEGLAEVFRDIIAMMVTEMGKMQEEGSPTQ